MIEYLAPEYAFEVRTKSTIDELSKKFVVIAKDIQEAIEKFCDSDLNNYNMNEISDVSIITNMRVIK